MPSLSARLAGFVLRTSGYYRRMYSGGALFQKNLAKVRAARLAEPSAKMRSELDVSQSDFGGRPVWRIAPGGTPASAHVLYWHGGGYVYPAMPAHWAFMAHMAKQYKWAITAPLYPLAPEESAITTTAWALDFYRSYASGLAGKPFVMGGDSAGGGLTAATAMLARDAGIAMPAGLLLVAPWLDIDPSHPDQKAIEPRDAILTLNGIREGGQMYAGNLAVTDPRVSPLYGDWSNLPPILTFGGGDDILVTDARALKEKVPSVDYVELADMIHDWPLFSFPESRKAQLQMADFVKRAIP